MDRTHNPEFTAMEIYVAYKDYIWMMAMVEECLETVAKAVHGIPVVHVGQHEINFAGPYEKLIYVRFYPEIYRHRCICYGRRRPA
jgi:lysyl-tRNA synthetase class 2